MSETGPNNNEPFFELPTVKDRTDEPAAGKKWYKKWWGILITVFGILVLTFLLIFFGQVYYFYSQLKSGRLSLPAKAKFQKAAAAATAENFDSEKISPPGEPNSAPGAPVTVVGFFDFQCPFSKEASIISRQIQNLYGDKINFIFRNFPITEIHPDAMLAAQAGECAQDKNLFWPMRDKIFNGQNLKEDTLKTEASELGVDAEEFALCLNAYQSKGKVLKDVLDGQALGVSGTPTWFIEGEKIEGVIPVETFKKIVDYLLAQKTSK